MGLKHRMRNATTLRHRHEEHVILLESGEGRRLPHDAENYAVRLRRRRRSCGLGEMLPHPTYVVMALSTRAWKPARPATKTGAYAGSCLGLQTYLGVAGTCAGRRGSAGLFG